jgi:hypothetical protein
LSFEPVIVFRLGIFDMLVNQVVPRWLQSMLVSS